MRIRTGDTVKVIAGKDRGKTGKVIQVFSRERKVVVEGVNILRRHLKSRGKKGQEKGQRIELAAPLSVSNVMLQCAACGKPARVGYKVEGTVKTRVCKRCGATV